MNFDGLEGTIRPGTHIKGKYRVLKLLGSGSFGQVWHAVHLKTKEEYALKIEKMLARPDHLQLQSEYSIYQKIKGPGFAEIKGFFVDSGFNVLVMQLLGPSLQDLLGFCGRPFTLKTVLMIANQLIERVQALHEKNYIHRDIKPENFVAGIGPNRDTFYLIDFGLSRKFRYYGKHFVMGTNRSLVGTARYSSIYTHMGISQARRDDMESLGYVLIYLLKGKLPWQGLLATSKKQKYEKILEVKMSTTLESLCQDLPVEFIMYLVHCRGLNFDKEPNYEGLKTLFRELFSRSNYKNNYKFDWKVLHGKTASDKNAMPTTPNYPTSRKRKLEK